MAKIIRKAGATSNILQIFIADSSSTTGAGLTGLVFNSSGLTAYYHKDTDTTATAISLVTMTVGTFTSSGFKEIDATNMPGWYQFCPPDAAFTSAKSVGFHLKGATNMAPLPIEVELWAVDPQVATNMGITALPTTAVTTNASLLTSGTGTDQLSVTSGRIDIGKALGTAVTLDANNVLNVSTKYVGGTLQTARDIGASVLLSAGTGTGQLDFTSGVVKANATQWLGGTIPAVNVTGVPKVDVVDWLGSAPNALRNGRVDSIPQLHTGTAQAGANGSITLAASGSSTDNLYTGQYVTIDSSVGANQTRLITGYTGSTKVATVSPNWTTNPTSASTYIIHPHGYVAAVTGDVIGNVQGNVNGSVASVTGAVGSVTGSVGSVTGAVGSVTGNVGGNVVGSVASVTAGVTVTTNNDKTGYALTSAYDFAKGTVAMTESYAAQGAAMTPAQALYQINQHLGESSIASTTKTVKKRDSSTTAKTFTLDSATTPTSITETT